MDIRYPETRIQKSKGLTSSENYLSQLCDKLFLSLWTYPNVYRNQGGAKEVCDLLVIFENHVFIFSDKECAFPKGDNLQVNWRRWYKKTIKDSATQIWGAERWIFTYPDNLYIDINCSQLFPLKIPNKNDAIVHRIVVAHGATAECRKHLDGNGSLMIMPSIIGDMHINTTEHECRPFALGQINPSKGFIHVFDDITLEVILNTLDTVSDLIDYLVKKEEFIQSGYLISAAGEEELLAYYLRNTDKDGEHYLIPRYKKGYYVAVPEGIWEEYCTNISRKAKLEEDKISYVWDEIIEKFSQHILNGTSYYLTDPNIQSQVEIFRFLARENRFKRRLLSKAFIGIFNKTSNDCRSTRIIKPIFKDDPFYLFFIFPKKDIGTYEDYRKCRGRLLGEYLYILKLQYPEALDIIGLATETGFTENRSEDFVYLDARSWTEEDQIKAKQLEKEFKELGILGERKMFSGIENEYPNTSNIKLNMKGTNRNMPCPCGSGKKYKKCCGKDI